MLIDTDKLKKAIKHYYDIAGDAIDKNITNKQREIDIIAALEKSEIAELNCVRETERLAKHKYGKKTYKNK